MSFNGKKYDDSPKVIYEDILERREFDDYELVWAFWDPNTSIKGRGTVVDINSFSFFVYALSSAFWIVNVSPERGLDFKKKKTAYINTWHGTPMKKMFADINNSDGTYEDIDRPYFDLTCAQGEFDQEVFMRIFHMKKENVIISGLPRNDVLLKYTADDSELIKKKLGIPLHKKVILYMPTFREYTKDSTNSYLFNPPMDLKKWEHKLSDKYVLLFRAHYLVVKNMKIEENDFVKDVSGYDTLSELYCVADMMISDYSSSFFDYSILERPMLCFAYDRQEYETFRGLYFELDELPCTIDMTEDDIIDSVLKLDYDKAVEKTRAFKHKYVVHSGNSSKKVIDEIISRYHV